MQASIISEVSRQKGDFWNTHDLLYAQHGNLSTAFLDALEKKQRSTPAQRKKAEQFVKQDLALAKKLNVAATPTFLVCTADGKVLLLSSVNQAENYLK